MEKLDEIEEDLPTKEFQKLADNVANKEDMSREQAVLYLMLNGCNWLDENTAVNRIWKRDGYATISNVTLQDDWITARESTKRLILHFQSQDSEREQA